MTFLGREFRPRLWSVAFTALGMTLFISLGLWQLQRAALKQGIMELYETRLSDDYLPFERLDATDDWQYRKVSLVGRFDYSRQMLVDNRIHQGKAGYHVLTPLSLADGSGTLLVNRGWIPQGATRDQLPTLAPSPDVMALRGVLVLPDDSGFQLGSVALGDQWPQVIPFIDMAALQTQFPGGVLPAILWMAPEISGNYVREWNPVWADPEKSRAYAVQWFSFAAIALLLFVVLNCRKTDE